MHARSRTSRELVETGKTRCLSEGACLHKNAAVMSVEQWRMVSSNDQRINRIEYRLRTHVVRVKEQNDTYFLLWILSHP